MMPREKETIRLNWLNYFGEEQTRTFTPRVAAQFIKTLKVAGLKIVSQKTIELKDLDNNK
jgi:hypothetical protein